MIAPLVVAVVAAATPAPPITRTASFAEIEAAMTSLRGRPGVEVSVPGRSVQGRALYLVRVGSGRWRVLLYAQQHGDEVSGKDALLGLISDVVAEPSRLPAGVELWVMPTLNPDGNEAGTRRNAAGADLNRDHMVLAQPETATLHRVAAQLRPHVAIDIHEFGRDGEAMRERGWIDWAEVTMDAMNHPLSDPALRGAALRWVSEAEKALGADGVNFARYTVGRALPEGEVRHSSTDADDGRNGLGLAGVLSLIVEVGARRSAPDGELGRRVTACRALLDHLLARLPDRAPDLEAAEAARSRPLPAYVATDTFWARPFDLDTEYRVIEAATGRTLRVPAPNWMTEPVVKRSAPRPAAYLVEPAAAAAYRAVLDRHDIPYAVLAEPRTMVAERCTLLRLEDDYDEVYNRYEGRQIVRREPAAEVTAEPGSLLVPLDGERAARAAVLLEPAMMYGMFRYPEFRPLATPGERLPVLRVP